MMIKKLFLLTISLAATCAVFSQNTFFKHFSTVESECVYDVIESTAGNYIVAGEKGIKNDSMHAFLVAADEEGFLTDEKVFSNGFTRSSFRTINDLPGFPGRYLVCGAGDSMIGMTSCSFLTLNLVNDSFKLLKTKHFPMSPGRKCTPWKVQFGEQGSFYLLYGYDTLVPGTFDFAITKFNDNFDSIMTFHIQSKYLWFAPQDILYDSHNHKLKVYYIGTELNDNNERQDSPVQILTLDENLNLLSHKPGPSPIITDVSALQLNDSSFFLAGTNSGTLTLPRQHIGLFRINQSDSLLKKEEFVISEDTILYTGMGGHNLTSNSLAGKMFLASEYNIDILHFPWQQKPSWIHILSFDDDMSSKKSSLYGGDAAYFPYSIKSTNDQGVIVAGARYDYNEIGEKQFDFFLLKTDSVGQLLSISDKYGPGKEIHLVYPNPGEHRVTVNLGSTNKPYCMQLLDQRGLLLFSKTIIGPSVDVELPELSSGMYLFVFSNERTVSGVVRWIKN